MQIVSYRGPGKAGGVSPALTRMVADTTAHQAWWHIDNDAIKYAPTMARSITRHHIPKAVIEGHYRYCNEFLWPVMHDLTEYATYRSEDRALYERFNRIFSREIASSRIGMHSKAFVQDYQLALLPKELQRMHGPQCGIFWHIPWPKAVEREFLPAMVDLARSMLCAEVIGFHTDEYCENFLNFLATHVKAISISSRDRIVTRETRMNSHYLQGDLLDLRGHVVEGVHSELSTAVISAPLGLDVTHWQSLARSRSNTLLHPSLINTDYVLSIDRADYTKGVIPRLESIHHFFADHPEMAGKITFAQLCTRTRPGLEAFDRYWMDIQSFTRELNSKYHTANWSPVLNIQGPLNASELSLLYGNASIMLVNPLRDGLNLTAKEFVACQSNNPGVLMLSPHAGAHEELGRWSVDADPFEPRKMSNTIFEALRMPAAEKKQRATEMFSRLRSNTIGSWCDKFKLLLEPQEARGTEVANG